MNTTATTVTSNTSNIYALPVSEPREVKISVQNLRVTYGNGAKLALNGVSLDVRNKEVTALIGPSGCGKSSFLRCMNRMNDLIEGCDISGAVYLDGINIYSGAIDVTQLRGRVGMVFQKTESVPEIHFRQCRVWPAYPRIDAKPRRIAFHRRTKFDARRFVERSKRPFA